MIIMVPVVRMLRSPKEDSWLQGLLFLSPDSFRGFQKMSASTRIEASFSRSLKHFTSMCSLFLASEAKGDTFSAPQFRLWRETSAA